jgi:hypothetical protein
MVKLFYQPETLLADMEMLYINETVFGVRERRLWTARTPVSSH